MNVSMSFPALLARAARKAIHPNLSLSLSLSGETDSSEHILRIKAVVIDEHLLMMSSLSLVRVELDDDDDDDDDALG